MKLKWFVGFPGEEASLSITWKEENTSHFFLCLVSYFATTSSCPPPPPCSRKLYFSLDILLFLLVFSILSKCYYNIWLILLQCDFSMCEIQQSGQAFSSASLSFLGNCLPSFQSSDFYNSKSHVLSQGSSHLARTKLGQSENEWKEGGIRDLFFRMTVIWTQCWAWLFSFQGAGKQKKP